LKKRLAIILLCAAVLVGIGGKVGYDWWDNHTYITIDGEKMRRDVTALNYSGKSLTELAKIKELSCLEKLDMRNTGLSAEQYEELQDAMPDCEILWQIPFQGGLLEQDTESVSVTGLSETDAAMLSYLEKLRKLDVTGCQNYALLEDLKASRPELEVHYTVRLGEGEYSCRAEELVLENADPEQLSAALPYLYNLTRVSFVGQTPDNEQIYEWKVAYPEVTFVWVFEVCGVSTDSMKTQLYLSDIPINNIEELESSLKYFYNLEQVELCRCGIPSEELDALWKRHPEIRFIWEVRVGQCTVRTDATTFMPAKFDYYRSGNRFLTDQDMGELKYCVDLICMDLGHMDISDYSFLNDMPNMQYLILADTRGKDFSPLASLKELKYLELFMTSFDQAEVLVGLTNLEDLNLGTTQITNVEPLKQMTWLKHLWLPANRNLHRPEKNALIAALPNTIINFQGAGSTGYGWRNIPNYYAMRDLLGMPYAPGK